MGPGNEWERMDGSMTQKPLDMNKQVICTLSFKGSFNSSKLTVILVAYITLGASLR